MASLIELESDRLRNLKAISLALSPGLTVLVGRNGQGKSSLLESIYLLATGRSFRTRRLDDLVAWGGGPLRVAGTVVDRLGKTGLSVVIDEAGRRLAVDGSEREVGDFLGRLGVVDLTGERMKVLRGGPDERRRFLDRGVVGLSTGFLARIADYRRVLAQRNALLRSSGGRLSTARAVELDVWDERLARVAAPLHMQRRRYAIELASRLPEVVRELFPDKELHLSYRPSPASVREGEASEFEGRYLDALRADRARDSGLGFTGAGPHRDDLRADLDGVDLRRFGSAGQVRAAMVALKLAKLSLLKEEHGEAPLFLMDDYDSDLDDGRAVVLAEHLDRGGFQAVVASSKESLVQKLGVSHTKLRMDDGEIRGV